MQPLASRDYGIKSCKAKAGFSSAAESLRILDAVYVDDLDILGAFCRADSLRPLVSSISIRSVHRDRIDLRELYEADYQLLLAKPELLSRGREGIDYELIARYPDYGSQLVSLHGTPELSREWMEGKVLGLLDDANSVSAYQIPVTALKASGLDGVPEIIYFRSHRQMYRALFSGEVDVIPALVSEEGPTSRLQLPPGLVLKETISGPAWYLRADLMKSRMHCELQSVLLSFSETATIHFFRGLQVVRACDSE